MSDLFTLRGGTSATSEAISLLDFVNTFAAKTNSLDLPGLHPAGAATITHWLDDMLDAAEKDDPAEVAKYVRMVTDKIALERQWYAESLQ